MKKTTKRILTLVMLVAMCLSMAMSVSAANVCSQITGSTATTRTFKVKTGKRFLLSDKLTFKQSKGVLRYETLGGREKTFNAYDTFCIRYQKEGSSTVKTAELKNGSCSIKLDKNSTYIVTVSSEGHGALQVRYIFKGLIGDWQKNPTWKVSKTAGIDFCS